MPKRKTKTRPTASPKPKLNGDQLRTGPGAWSLWIAAAVLAASIGVVYGSNRPVHSPFIFDDEVTINKNSSITTLWPLVGPVERPGPLNPPSDLPTSGRPLVNLSFAINYYVGELNPLGYHVVNVVLHFLSAMLVWAVMRRTLRLPFFAGRFDSSAEWLALAVALLWGLHPLQTETVVYVTQRTELMVSFFYLATFYCSLQYWAHRPLSQSEVTGKSASVEKANSGSSNIWLILATLACAAGMASKEVMVSAPLMVLLFERTFIAGTLKEALRRSWPLYVGLAATWLLLLLVNLGAPRAESAGFSLGVSPYYWWLTQAKVLLIYLKLVFWPSPLLLHYVLPYYTSLAQAWMYVVPVLLLAVVVCVLLWRNHPLGFLGTLMFAILSPTLVVPILTEMAAERRMYLPLLALVIAFVVGAYELAQWMQKHWASFTYARAAVATLTVLLAVTFAVVSMRRVADYDKEERLWQGVVMHQPSNYFAHNNLGRMLLRSGRLPEAITELRVSLALNPKHYLALNNLGVALDHSGRYSEAIEALNEALRLNPTYTDALQNLGNSLRQVGRIPEAKEKLKRALELRPDDAEAQNNMGVLMASSNDVPQAIEHFRLAARLNRNYAAAHINLGKILATSGSVPEAISELKQAIKLQPDRADLHNELGVILGQNQQNEAAIEHFETAVKLDPKFAQAYSNMALSLALINRPADAIAMSQRGIAVARSTGQQDVAKLAEEWLTHYREEIGQGGSPSK